MELLSRYLTSEIEEFNRNNVQVRFMGSREGLPEVVKQKMDHAVEATKNNTGIILNLAINYGGQAEILQAIQRIAADTEKGLLKVEDIQAETFENYLYTAGLPAPDLLIRPGGIIVSVILCCGKSHMRKFGLQMHIGLLLPLKCSCRQSKNIRDANDALAG